MKEPKLPVKRMVLYAPVSLSLCALGLLLLMTWIFPLGFICLWLSAYPYVRWLSKKIHVDIAYAERDHGLLEKEKSFPWETEAELDETVINIILHEGGRGK